MLEWVLYGSQIASYVLVLIYGQIMFVAFRWLYKLCGLLYLITLVLSLAWTGLATYWTFDNDCTDTTFYYMSVTNVIALYILVILMLLLITIFY